MSRLAIDPAVLLIAGGALSLLFGSAAAHKLRDVQRFRDALAGYDLMPRLWTVPAGALLVAAELGIAAGLWLPRVAPAASLAAAALLMLYAAAMGVNLRRGRRDLDCGCGGPAGRQFISVPLVVRNAALAGVALLGVLPVTARSLLWLDAVTIVGGVASAVLLYAAADGLLAARRLATDTIEADPAVTAASSALPRGSVVARG